MLPEFRKEFNFDQASYTHFNNAAWCPVPSIAVKSAHDFISKIANEAVNCFEEIMDIYETDKEVVAKFVGAAGPENVAFTPNCATAISMIAQSLEYKSGENIVTWEQEYASNAYTWHQVSKKHQLELISVPSEKNYDLDVQRLVDAINPKTKIVTISWIQSQAGTETPLLPVIDACKKNGALLLVDCIQGLGNKPFDLKKYPVDFLCSGSHKWLCGALGHGFLVFGKDHYKTMKPILQGAMSYGLPQEQTDLSIEPRIHAARFEPGAPQIIPSRMTIESMKVLMKHGVDNIHQTTQKMRRHMVEHLKKLGAIIKGNQDMTLGNSTITFELASGTEKIQEALIAEKISFSLKPAGLRLSPHAFNTIQECDKILQIIESELSHGG